MTRVTAIIVVTVLAFVAYGPVASAEGGDCTTPAELLVRCDADGGQTVLLHVEDAPGGTYTYQAVATPANVPKVRQMGAFTHAFTTPQGAPIMAAGVFTETEDTGLVRVPLVLVENVAHTAELTAKVLQLVAESVQQADHAVPYASEILLPELSSHLATAPDESSVSGFRDHETIYVWTVHRTSPAGAVWAGQFLSRSGSTTPDGTGGVSAADKRVVFGHAVRVDSETRHLGGVFVDQAIEASGGSDTMQQQMTLTVGVQPADGGAVPLASVRFEDAREGTDLAGYPDEQMTAASLGVQGPDGYVPLVGVQTTQTTRPSHNGMDVERITSVGAYVDGTYVPVLGGRFHSDTHGTVGTALALALDGPGARTIGNFEVDVGPFVEGEYVPAAGAVHRMTFREARFEFASSVSAGVYAPTGFVPVAMATYDGTLPLLEWVSAFVAETAPDQGWMIAAGTSVAGDYVPVIGIENRPTAPLGTRDDQAEFRIGTFAAAYSHFVPLASVSYDGDFTVVQHALAFVLGGGPGAPAGGFDLAVGAYAVDDYVGLAGVGFRSEFTGSHEAETLFVVGVYVANEFVPVIGVAYESEYPLVQSLQSPTSTTDDEHAQVRAGVFVDGTFVTLVQAEHDGESTRVTLAP